MSCVQPRLKFTHLRPAIAVAVCLLTTAASGSAATLTVNAGGDLQAALNAAQPGDEIVLAAGARFVGAFRLPPKPSGPVITIRSSAPLPNRRITPNDASLLPILVSGQVDSALTAANTANWRLDGIRFESNRYGQGNLIALENATNITLDRILIIAGAEGQRRGVMGNGRNITLTRSHIANIWSPGVDSQAFCAWDGAGPYTITDNYLEAASENVMFGGADSTAPDRMPSDILVEGNHFSKPLEWKGQSKNVKNLFELKAARRVIIRNNLFERNWTDGQSGTAIVFTPRNQDGRAPWSAVEDVLFERNTIRDTEAVFNLLGRDGIQPSGRLTRITIRQNLAVASRAFLIAGAEVGVLTLDHNTTDQYGNFMTLYKGDVWEPGSVARPAQFAIESLTMTNSIGNHAAYGVFGDDTGIGTIALEKLTRSYTWTHNVLAGEAGQIYSYPQVTWQPSMADHRARLTNTYTLVAGSPYINAGNDGQDLGVVWNNTQVPAPPPPAPAPPPPPPNTILVVSPPVQPIRTVGIFTSYLFKADQSGAWYLTGGSLPPGMLLSAAGLLFGTPTASGKYFATLTVRNSTMSGSATFEMRVLPATPRNFRIVTAR